jgi:hypothetical protein
LDDFPADTSALDGIAKAREYQNVCTQVVGTWSIAPNGVKWVVKDDNTVFGTWLIFQASGQWECLGARKREFVMRWPGCVLCITEFFILSDDGNILLPTRGTQSVGTRTQGAQLNAPDKPKSTEEKAIDGVIDGVRNIIQGVGSGPSQEQSQDSEQ